MGLLGDLRRKIDKKQKEISELRGQRGSIQSQLRELDTRLREANAALAAYEEIARIAPEDADEQEGPNFRAGSTVALARAALQKVGEPMHISKILESIGKSNTHEQKVSLSSSLAAYVRKTQIFTRPEPNIFGLIEWAQTKNESESSDDRPIEVAK